MVRLGVNIDHVATLRQARGTTYPSLTEAAALCEQAGAHGITIHLREDRRHIQDADVYALRAALKTRLNLEMANNPDVLAVALDVRPDEVCIVPERRQELTTEGGLDAAGLQGQLAPTVAALRAAGILVSLFIEPDERQVEAAAALGAPFIELHTGTFAARTGEAREAELARLAHAAVRAHEFGLRVNAGHGLTVENVGAILEIPHLDTLNIGHSIVCRAIAVGLAQATREMLERIGGGNREDA
ncbi:MAG TPA: pyridoxine 5'-phosphate synthase [Kiritimatiellia bacterium]|jgi:pyridoxine 5-phosphate synthase|nr:pyridoxine 5'-phosphate synthase [Kiritimatiellia bacterium]HOM58791.1 pyridoxine 5'-phosphate synthase [Kiritimatiellia bacterium]HOR98346.1 pyridoxine 5'-phosphate synthase [Kiritimatiellia bacterium]HPC48630.1 pyridoxine 5'-phosphate synthase [Kiritimatiellia bacterium]HPW74637.1 pyridoxine 5'-phosphate synthase [Kiritimatiellia bacterium]